MTGLGSYSVIRGVLIHILESWDTSHRCLKTTNQKTQESFQHNMPVMSLITAYITLFICLCLSTGQIPLTDTLLDACLNYPSPNTAAGT